VPTLHKRPEAKQSLSGYAVPKLELGNEKRFFAAYAAQNDRFLTENRKQKTENRF